MCVRIIQVLDNTLSPLEALFAERATAVQRHHSSQVLKFLALFGACLEPVPSANLKPGPELCFHTNLTVYNTSQKVYTCSRTQEIPDSLEPEGLFNCVHTLTHNFFNNIIQKKKLMGGLHS